MTACSRIDLLPALIISLPCECELSMLQKARICNAIATFSDADLLRRNENSNVYERRLKFLVYCLECASQVADESGTPRTCELG